MLISASPVLELKKGRAEPDAEQAATLGADSVDQYNTERYNPQVREFLSRMPGVTSKNIFGLLNQADSLLELLTLTEERLAEILGSKQNAAELHQALHGAVELPDKQKQKKPFKRFKSRK